MQSMQTSHGSSAAARKRTRLSLPTTTGPCWAVDLRRSWPWPWASPRAPSMLSWLHRRLVEEEALPTAAVASRPPGPPKSCGPWPWLWPLVRRKALSTLFSSPPQPELPKPEPEPELELEPELPPKPKPPEPAWIDSYCGSVMTSGASGRPAWVQASALPVGPLLLRSTASLSSEASHGAFHLERGRWNSALEWRCYNSGPRRRRPWEQVWGRHAWESAAVVEAAPVVGWASPDRRHRCSDELESLDARQSE